MGLDVLHEKAEGVGSGFGCFLNCTGVVLLKG